MCIRDRISSWTNWWYAGGSFSARAIVPSFVLLAIPLGFLLRDLATIGWARTSAMIGVSACVVLNLFPVSYTHLRAHATVLDIVCRLLLETQHIQHSFILMF